MKNVLEEFTESNVFATASDCCCEIRVTALDEYVTQLDLLRREVICAVTIVRVSSEEPEREGLREWGSVRTATSVS